MDNTTLKYYNGAIRDYKLNSIPTRLPDGSYGWNDSQLAILTQPQYNEIRKIHTEMEQSIKEHETLFKEMLVYQKPTNELECEATVLAQKTNTEIDEEKFILNDLKSAFRQYDEDMLNRGFNIPDDIQIESSTPIEEKEKKKSINWRTVFGFLGIWSIGEIFMTYVQWNALRDQKGIEDLIVRSLSFGVVLFLIHYVAHLNKQIKRTIYYWFLAFSFTMLLVMLFAPLTLNQIYPIGVNSTSIAEEWSISNEEGQTNIPESNYPFWVKFYRSYEITPAILCFLLFVGIQSFMPSKKRESLLSDKENEPRIETVQDQIRRKRSNLLAKIKCSETRIENLSKKLSETLVSNTRCLNDVLNQLQETKKAILLKEKKIAESKIALEEKIKALEKDLNLYKTEFRDILRNDQVKSLLITPVWPNRNDILNFYKI
jgi:hypothetical protein